MNKKGFTLIEILLVITILAVLGVSSTIAVTEAMKTSKERKYNNLVQEIENAAEVYMSINNEKLSSELYNCESTTSCSINVTLGSLQGDLLIESDAKDPRNNELLRSNTYVKITYDKNSEEITYLYYN